MGLLTESNTIGTGQEVGPLLKRLETVMDRDERTLSETSDVRHHVVLLDVAIKLNRHLVNAKHFNRRGLKNLQAGDGINANLAGLGLVDDTEHGNDILVLVLRDKLGDGTHDVQRTLSVGETHNAVHPMSEVVSLAKTKGSSRTYQLI